MKVVFLNVIPNRAYFFEESDTEKLNAVYGLQEQDVSKRLYTIDEEYTAVS